MSLTNDISLPGQVVNFPFQPANKPTTLLGESEINQLNPTCYRLGLNAIHTQSMNTSTIVLRVILYKLKHKLWQLIELPCDNKIRVILAASILVPV